jgi:alpha-tubulin suppressor-like RCC1 family protein
MWKFGRALVAFIFVGSLFLLNVVEGAGAVSTSSSQRTSSSILDARTASSGQVVSPGQDICAQGVPAGIAHCNSVLGVPPAVLPNQVSVGVPAVSALGDDGAYSPAFLQSAYNVASASKENGGGVGQIVAVVDAYSNPTTVSDLAYYRSFFKLSACPVGLVSAANTSCKLQIVNESGAASPLPPANSSWGLEESIDIDMVSAICPKCQILLVETNSAAIGDLGTGVNSAVSLGATVVSNSYGSAEYPSEVTDTNTYFNHPHIPIVVAAGDAGYGVEFPATSPDVISVGGTTLNQLKANGVHNGSSTVWSDSGAGCSAYEPKPTWQTDTGCANRSDNDIAAVGDPATGVWVYDTTGYTGLEVAGGTSVAAPIIGAMYALAGSTNQATYPAQTIYSNEDELTGVFTGSDGTCGSYLCNAALRQGHYDGPAGAGTPSTSPNSLSAFVGTSGVNAATTPSQAKLVSAVASSASVTLHWAAPPGSSPVTTGYEVLEGIAGQTPSSTPINNTVIASNSYVVSGLTNGRSYSFSIEVKTSSGISAPSNVLLATPLSSTSVSSAPVDVIASPGYGEAVITWTAPVTSSNTAVTSYDVTDHQGATCTVLVASNKGNECTVEGLTNGQSYVFSVEANNTAGASAWSLDSVAVIPGGVPGEPVNVAAVSGSQSAIINWAPPLADGNSNVVSYLATDGTTHTCSVVVTPSSSDSCTINGLTNGDTYQFSITATNSAGTSASSPLTSPVLVATNTPATSVSAGQNFACALFAGGTVKCWGNNDYGQLGNGTFISSASQVQVLGVTGATQISTGINSACAIVAHGAVKCWGSDAFYQLGNGAEVNASTPVTVSGLTDVHALTSGFQFRCALITGGTAKCWGYNDNGQLGNGTFTTERTPVSVKGISGATSIVVDEDHTCAIITGGVVKCWGANKYGELGDQTRITSKVPVTVKGLRGVTAIGVGFSNTCALLGNRTVKCWGYNTDGELGNATTRSTIVPTSVAGVKNVVSLDVGNFNSCAEMSSGTIDCWGLNSATALAINATKTPAAATPSLDLAQNLTISLDSGYSCSLLKNQTVECWIDGATTVVALWFPDSASPSAPNATTRPS